MSAIIKRNGWTVEMRSVENLQDVPSSDVINLCRRNPTQPVFVLENLISGIQRRDDVTGGSSFLSELKNLNKLFFGRVQIFIDVLRNIAPF